MFALDSRNGHADASWETAGAGRLVARYRRQTVSAVAKIEATGRDALGLGRYNASGTRDTASAFLGRRTSVRSADSAVTHIHAAMLDAIDRRGYHTLAAWQTAGAGLSAGADERRTGDIIALIDAVGISATRGS